MMFLNVVWFLFGYILCPSTPVEGSFPQVSTPLGRIIGFHCTSKSGKRYEAYEGIPYAQPPIGEYRFQVARSVSPWKGVRMAKRLGTSCLQYAPIPRRPEPPGKTLKGSEDCLYLNIYTADSETQRNLLPVIFFIHGGAFQFGSGAVYRPKYLLDRNVTLVTFNYRLGPLGFLSTEDETVPGNMGLKDQVIALRWVKDNIQFFGGDPSRITITGQSAGGASVHYHYLSKLSSGLFQRGMSLSGTALNCWAQTEEPLEKAKRLATILGCRTDNIRRMVDCLREKPADQITHAVGYFMPFLYNPFTPFGPVVEKGGGEFTFIDRSPIDVITSGDAEDVPWITSNVSEEGLFPAAQFIVKDKLLEDVNEEWSTLAPYLLDFNYTVPRTDHAAVAGKIKQHYLGTRGFSDLTVDRTVQMISDRLYMYDAEKAARLQARANRSPVRYYYFSYRGSCSVSDLFIGNRGDLGVCHTDDLFYVLKTGLKPAKTPRDRKMQRVLIDLWVSFATDGEPDLGIDWRGLSRSDKSEFRYLHIAGPRNIRMEKCSNFGNKKFWSTIDFQENIPRPSNSSSQSDRKIAEG